MSQTNNDCNPELVSAFLDNELDRIIVGHVAKHLIHCDHCCQAMGRLAQIRDLMMAGQLPWFEGERFIQSVMMAINNEKSTSPRERLRDRLLRFGIPALLVGTILAEVLPSTVDAANHVEYQEIHR
ncbi:MAG: hypothetical protein HQL99_07975 [Magnetococcales bacterium]|nr:hypothetical protein [Magnetococcales bacterium]